MTTTGTIGAASNTSSGSVVSTSNAKYSDNSFLNLLVAQLQAQTPLKPVDNDVYMQQLASYSSMTEQKQLNDNLLKLLDFQGALARLQGLSQSSSLLGKNVTYVTDETGQNVESGVVDSVFVDDAGEVKLKIGDREISMKQIVGVAQGEGSEKKGGEGDETQKKS